MTSDNKLVSVYSNRYTSFIFGVESNTHFLVNGGPAAQVAQEL
jgi:hypothetical protein